MVGERSAPLRPAHEGEEATALPQSPFGRLRYQRAAQPWWHLNPRQRAALYRMYRSPIMLVMSLTMPLVSNRKNSGALYPKPFAVALPLVLPLLLSAYWFDWSPLTADWSNDRPLQLTTACCLLTSLVLSIIYPSDGRLEGPLLGICTVAAFVGSMIWMQFAAEEVVAVTVSCGTIFEISSPLLAATFLSWAGAAGDTVSNLALARDGFPTMALTACFSSPLFVLLGGLSCTFFYVSKEDPDGEIVLPRPKELIVLYVSCVVVCCFWVAAIPLLFKYQLTTRTAVVAILLYLAFQSVYVVYAV